MPTVKSIVRSPACLTGLAAAAIFLLDLELPNGVVDGILYVLVILLSARIPRAQATWYAAALLMPLMVFGFLLSPMAAPVWVAVTNRLVSVLVVWTTACLIWRHSRGLVVADKISHPAIALTDAVRDDLILQLGIIEWRLQRLPYYAGRASELKKEALILSSALKNARHCVRATSASAHPPHQTGAR
jgi:hypothetical protein